MHVPIISQDRIGVRVVGLLSKSGKKNIASFFLFELTYCSHIHI